MPRRRLHGTWIPEAYCSPSVRRRLNLRDQVASR
jgi:hypothetical protein